MGGVDGVLDPRVEAVPEEPVLAIETDLARAEPYGIKPGDVRRATAMLLQGIVVGNIFGEQKVFEVVVKGVPDVRESVESVSNMLIDTPGGGHVRLDQVADVRIQPSPAVIRRDAAQRYVDVEANVSGRSLDAVATDVEDRLADSQFPLEYHAEVLEQTTTAQEINLGRVVGFGIAALIAIFLLFQAAFRSWRLAGLAFLTLPVALVGGVLAALIDGATLSLGALIALLALLGLAARNGVMLIDRFQRLRLDEAAPAFGADLVRRGAHGEVCADVDRCGGDGRSGVAVRDLGKHRGSRDRQPDGDRDAGRFAHLHVACPLRATGPIPALRCRRRARTGSRDAWAFRGRGRADG